MCVSEKINQFPLRVSNASSKPKDQLQLLHKFRQLRQWQQQQQENMFMQQHQHLEIFRREQDELQNIIATQKSIYQQQGTEEAPVPSSGGVVQASQENSRNSFGKQNILGNQDNLIKTEHPGRTSAAIDNINKKNERNFTSDIDSNPSSKETIMRMGLLESVRLHENAQSQDLNSSQRLGRNETSMCSVEPSIFVSNKSIGKQCNNYNTSMDLENVRTEPIISTCRIPSTQTTTVNTSEVVSGDQRTYPVSWQSKVYALPLGRIPQTSLFSEHGKVQTSLTQPQEVAPYKKYHAYPGSNTVYKVCLLNIYIYIYI